MAHVKTVARGADYTRPIKDRREIVHRIARVAARAGHKGRRRSGRDDLQIVLHRPARVAVVPGNIPPSVIVHRLWSRRDRAFGPGGFGGDDLGARAGAGPHVQVLRALNTVANREAARVFDADSSEKQPDQAAA